MTLVNRIFERTVFLILIFFPLIVFGQNIKSEKALDDSLLAFRKQILRQGDINRGREYTDSNLVNGTGVLIKFGTVINGYMVNYFDTTRFGKITVIEEYVHYKKNGRRIQFFDYPNDTASIEVYSEGMLNGFFYYNHANGKRKKMGIYNKDTLVQIQFWDDNGEEIEVNNSFESFNELFYINGKLCNGHRRIYRCSNIECSELLADLYFTEGRIDSARLYKSYGYWGKPLFEIHINYLDSTRKAISYHGPSGYIHRINSFKMVSINML
jgi:hypothetical protein